MPDSPEDPSYVARLVDCTPLLPESRLRAHWRSVLPWLTTDERYELAAVLVAVEHALRSPSA